MSGSGLKHLTPLKASVRGLEKSSLVGLGTRQS